MQLICHYDVTNFAKWKAAFDADAESRRTAGLTVLQVWQDVDSTRHAVVLMSVNDRDRAGKWLDRSQALSSDDGATVTAATSRFVETA